MRLLVSLMAAFAILACSSDSVAPRIESTRILFVGNSLTYVGNLPAVVDALSENGGPRTSSDMIVTGGATLTDRVADGAVARALEAQKYAFVVLQERGGDFACGFGPQVCADARRSLRELSELIRQHGAMPVLLGTYQSDPEFSRRLVAAESEAAAAERIRYISVSDRLQQLRTALPAKTWFASDGMHPGSDLTLLEALLLFRELHGVNFPAVAVTVRAPIYPQNAVFEPDVRSASTPSDPTRIPQTIIYDADRVMTIVQSLR